jgi:hypothetical protein
MTRAGTAAAAASVVLGLLAMSPSGDIATAAQKPALLKLAAGARVGVVNLLDPEVTHFHASRQLQNSFLKTYTVGWPVGAMLMQALRDGLAQVGLTPVAAAPTEALMRARETCFLNAALGKALPKPCGPLYGQLAAAEHLDALIVLGPGLNDSTHAGGGRRRGLPEYLRGWCVVSEEGVTAGVPSLINLSELLLIGVTTSGAELGARQWGGEQNQFWTGFKPPADLKSLADAQLNELQPLFAGMLKQQAGGLLTHLEVAR